MDLTPFGCALALALGATLVQAQPRVLRLWTGAAPGDTGSLGEEHDTTTPKDNLIAGRTVIRLGNVSVPTITVYRAGQDKATGAAVVVCPGGGYHILAMDLEGTEVCEWLNSIGVTAVLLKYRVPVRPGQAQWLAPLQDVQRAVGMVRYHAKEWGLDPERIGVLGFSAGGHLCATLSAHSGPRAYPRVDGADDLSCKPDFQLLIYPGGLALAKAAGALQPEVAVSPTTPPTILVIAMDDPVVGAENGLNYAMALKESGVPMEFHAYPTGGHGYGLRPTKDYVTTWPARAEDWMRSRGLLDPKARP